MLPTQEKEKISDKINEHQMYQTKLQLDKERVN